MKKFISTLLILSQVLMFGALFAPSKAQATTWCSKPIQRTSSNPVAGLTVSAAVNGTMFYADSNDAPCAVDLHISGTGCTGSFQVKIYGNVTNYNGEGAGHDGPDVGGGALATSNTIDCNQFVGDGGTFYGYQGGMGFHLNRFSFTSNIDGSGTTTASALTSGNKYWLILTSSGATGLSGVYWSIVNTQVGRGSTGRTRSGATVSSMSTTDAAHYARFKMYSSGDPGIIMDTTYNCDEFNYETTDPICVDGDPTGFFAGTGDHCSTTENGFGNGVVSNPYYVAKIPDGPKERITTAANYPGGGGVRGQRHYIGIIKCYHDCGSDANGSGAVQFWFVKPGPNPGTYVGTKEAWFRAYLRYDPGWRWGGLATSKTYYPNFWSKGPECATWGNGCYFGSAVNMPNGNCDNVHCQAGNGQLPQDGLHLGMGWQLAEGDHRTGGCSVTNSYGPCGWKDFYPTGTSDGTFHMLELHAKLNDRCGAGIGPCNGVFEIYIDGVLKASDNNRDFGNPYKQADGLTPIPCVPASGSCNPLHNTESPELLSIAGFKMGDNGNLFWDYNTIGCHAIDYDDIKVSTDGLVGGIGGNNVPLAAGLTGNVHVE